MIMLYPWQESDYKYLIDSYVRGNFTCLLVQGAANSGREKLLDRLINYMLCLDIVANQPCGKCSACILFAENNHPDYYILAADSSEERKNNTIKVEQIRDLIDFAIKSRHISTQKIIFLPDVGQLNLNSANALLKILEEPPQGCIFILWAANISQVLPTILSRAFKYQLRIPTREQALAHMVAAADINAKFWLDYFGGEPLFEIPLDNDQLGLLQNGLLKPSIDNIFNLTRELDPKKIGMRIWLEFLSKWLTDLSSLKLGGKAAYFIGLTDSLAALARQVNLTKLFNFYDELIFMLPWSEHPLNHKLQLENLLFEYQQIYISN